MTEAEFETKCTYLKLLKELQTRKLLNEEKLEAKIKVLVNEMEQHLLLTK
jgi:hypothetical protein